MLHFIPMYVNYVRMFVELCFYVRYLSLFFLYSLQPKIFLSIPLPKTIAFFILISKPFYTPLTYLEIFIMALLTLGSDYKAARLILSFRIAFIY